MLAGSGCPGWEYSSHPERHLLKERSSLLLRKLRGGEIDPSHTSRDTRPSHKSLFEGLTPLNCDYYAGSYRGEKYRCLMSYAVTIPADGRVGYPASDVLAAMRLFSDKLKEGFGGLDSVVFQPGSKQISPEGILRVVKFACKFFVNFLTIHPFANGNGHMGRLIIWCILGRYGLWPKCWPLDERPPDPPYSRLIAEFRDGKQEGLEKFVLQCLIGSVGQPS